VAEKVARRLYVNYVYMKDIQRVDSN
jgi:hypothetical protein